jgi:glutamate synthase domain-containing protein 3
MKYNADGIYYKQVNEDIHAAIAQGDTDIVLENVRGQRYIGVGLGPEVKIEIHGVPGNDLAAFMNGAVIDVLDNAQDGVSNTMNDGKVIIHGDAGDIVAYAMRGGKLFIQGDVGYRTGIHMKAYHDHYPTLVVGGGAGDYLGEYMAGGMLIVLNMADLPRPAGDFVGTGMHGGAIYIRGKVEPHQVGAEVGFQEVTDEEWAAISAAIAEFCSDLGLENPNYQPGDFMKLYPKSARPYGNLYAY